jgi:archaeosortase A (PGF-CTERM-specific)
MAAIATLIYVPFALVPPLHDALIALVVALAFGLITALGNHPQMVAWDVFYENAFSNQIILGCTGITAIALMLGVAFSGKDFPLRQAVLAFLLVVPPVFVLNLVRVVVVFIAVSSTWFAAFPDPTGTGDANFFWAHNVIAEALAILFLLALAWGLVRIIPGLGVFVPRLVGVYRDCLRNAGVRVQGIFAR